jgi:hypothetical protein
MVPQPYFHQGFSHTTASSNDPDIDPKVLKEKYEICDYFYYLYV